MCHIIKNELFALMLVLCGFFFFFTLEMFKKIQSIYLFIYKWNEWLIQKCHHMEFYNLNKPCLNIKKVNYQKF